VLEKSLPIAIESRSRSQGNRKSKRGSRLNVTSGAIVGRRQDFPAVALSASIPSNVRGNCPPAMWVGSSVGLDFIPFFGDSPPLALAPAYYQSYVTDTAAAAARIMLPY